MRRHLNTLYITTQGAWLSKDGQNVVVSLEGKELARVPVHTIGAIVGFGRVLVSPPLMGACGAGGICITHLTEEGRFLARVEGPVSGNVLLRRTQYRWADDPQRRDAIIRSIVIGKTLNQRAVLARALRDHGETMPDAESAAISGAADRLASISRRAERPSDGDVLRGLEGEAAQVYFSVFDHLIRGDRETFRFKGRNRRPPLDPVNALLSFIGAARRHLRERLRRLGGLRPLRGLKHFARILRIRRAAVWRNTVHRLDEAPELPA